MMLRLTRGSKTPLVAAVCFLGVLALYNLRGFHGKAINHDSEEEIKTDKIDTNSSQKYQRVAVASVFEFHHDVYMSFASTMAQALNRTSKGSLEVYARVPFSFQFQAIVDELGFYPHEYRDPEDLYPALKIVDESTIDLLVLGTCEADLREERSKVLLEIWDGRPPELKFKLVCIVHNTADLSWQPAITEWSRRNAIRIVAISEHVAATFRRKFDTLADSHDPKIRSASYENIPVDVHVPVLSLRDLPERSTNGILSKAVIQGSFSVGRRDYLNVFKDLIASLEEDPTAWGYRPLEGQQTYQPDTDASDPPFQLFLLGSGWLEIPTELKNVVQIKTGLTYREFYGAMNEMDICVPALGSDDYFTAQASSTFAMAIECNLPILVTRRIRKSYAYTDDDRVVVTRPAAVGEIAALKLLRTGNTSAFLDVPMPNLQGTMRSVHFLQEAVEGMLQRGWGRTKDEFESFKLVLWNRNEEVARRILHDL